MSISTEITRISGNVSDALTAIGAKGVTVPTGSNSDDLADLIGAITGNLTTKTITLNGSYSAEDDSADGYSAVTVNVQGGASMSEVANQYGTELVITSAPGSAPSATRHTLYFELEDETTATVYAYYDSAFIGSAITATTPTTYDGKTVTSAQLDGVEWYSYTPEPAPSGDWTTLYDGQITAYESEATIPSLADLYFAEGETYRVTIDGTEYVRETAYFDGAQSLWAVGNPNMISREPEAGEDQFCVFNAGWGALYVVFPGSVSADHTFKLEKQGG